MMTWREAEEAANAGGRIRCTWWTRNTYVCCDENGRLRRKIFREGLTREGKARENAGYLYRPSDIAIRSQWEVYR